MRLPTALLSQRKQKRQLTRCSSNLAPRSPASQPTSAPSAVGRPDRLEKIRREAGQRGQPADIGVRDALLGGEVGDGLRLTALDPPPPAVRAHSALTRVSSRLGFRAGAAAPSGVMISLRLPRRFRGNWDADGQLLQDRARVCIYWTVASIMMLRSGSSEAALRA